MATTNTTEQINEQLKFRLNAQAMEIIRLRQEIENLNNVLSVYMEERDEEWLKQVEEDIQRQHEELNQL